jgi:hypothetical protein
VLRAAAAAVAEGAGHAGACAAGAGWGAAWEAEQGGLRHAPRQWPAPKISDDKRLALAEK